MSIMGDVLEIGDEVVLNVLADNREGGYNPGPDGLRGKIVGWHETAYGRTENYGVPPGIYEADNWPIVEWENGSPGDVGVYHLDLADMAEYEARVQRRRERILADRAAGKEPEYTKHVFVRPLPETPFWEDDHVRLFGQNGKEDLNGPFSIASIRYMELGGFYSNGNEKWPYTVRSEQGFDTWARESSIVLVERGNVWKYYHGEPLTFSDLHEEASFYQRLGRTKEVRNPTSGLYVWTKEGILEAIRNGIAHGFVVSSSMFSDNKFDRAILFEDEEVGKRVAAATLQGFGL